MIISNINIGMKGFYRLQTINKVTGKCRIDTGWFPNVLLTAGMNEMANRNFITSCQVGTDGADANSAQTGLLGYHAGTSNVTSTLWGNTGLAPFYGWKRVVYRFAAGTVAANLSEVGVGWATIGDTLISRAKILDPVLQTPTTITPLADELLDVSYELRYYPPLVDVPGPQVTLDNVLYDTITRAASVNGDGWSYWIGDRIGVETTQLSDWSAYDGNIGTIEQDPSGLTDSADNENHFNSAYVNNSFEVQVNASIGSLGWNLAAGIRSLGILTSVGRYQTQFNAVTGGASIPKTDAYQMLMSWKINWAELPDAWVLPGIPYSIGDRVTHTDVQWESDIDSNSSEPGVANWTQV